MILIELTAVINNYVIISYDFGVKKDYEVLEISDFSKIIHTIIKSHSTVLSLLKRFVPVDK